MKDYLEQTTGISPHKNGIWNVEIWLGGKCISKTHESDDRLQTEDQVKALAISRLNFKITMTNLKP